MVKKNLNKQFILFMELIYIYDLGLSEVLSDSKVPIGVNEWSVCVCAL